MAFVVMPLVFVFAFATHPGLLRPRILCPEQLIDRLEDSGCSTGDRSLERVAERA